MRGVVEMSWFFVGLMTAGTYVAVRAYLLLHLHNPEAEIEISSGPTFG